MSAFFTSDQYSLSAQIPKTLNQDRSFEWHAVCTLFRDRNIWSSGDDMKKLLLACVACAALNTQAHAVLISTTVNTTSPQPPTGSTATVVAVQGATLGSASYAPAGAVYSITVNAAALAQSQGFVQGTIPSSAHATPVAGVVSGQPRYLSGDYGSAQVTSPDVSKYLSTGTGTVTINFTTPQTSLALLWGSIDSSNLITFSNGDTLTGSQVQLLAASSGFAGNGFQGPLGSAYVSTTSSTSFNSVTFSSGVTSFEFAGVVGSTPSSNVPEPVSLALLGTGLIGLGLTRRRFTK